MILKLLRNLVLPAALMALAANAAQAQDLPTAAEARKDLYKTGKRVTIVRILVPDLVPAPYKTALEKAASIQKYYEAMAASPSEGMLAASASHAANHHSAAAAHEAAIAGCNAKKKSGSKACVVVAEFLPKTYEGPRDFSLSANATEVFGKSYRRARGDKAFAISPQTGNWGEAVKAGSLEAARAEALAACAAKAAKAGAKDCVLVSEN